MSRKLVTVSSSTPVTAAAVMMDAPSSKPDVSTTPTSKTPLVEPSSPSSPSSSSYSLLPRSAVPGWTARNPFILSGYRPPHLPLGTLLHSALPPPFHRTHNQTANILTHLLPCLFFFLTWPLREFDARFPDAPALDRGIMAGYVVAVVSCLGLSAAYHTLACRSETWNDRCLKLDYVGITLVTAGSFIPGIHLLFYCDDFSWARYFHWGLIVTLGVINISLLVHPRTGGEDFWPVRLVLFVLLGNSAFVPILYAASVMPYDRLVEQAALNYYYLEGVLFMAGTGFLATRFPESSWPGKFDYWGGSHSIFHSFIVAGMVTHLLGLLAGYEWQYAHPGQACVAPV